MVGPVSKRQTTKSGDSAIHLFTTSCYNSDLWRKILMDGIPRRNTYMIARSRRSITSARYGGVHSVSMWALSKMEREQIMTVRYSSFRVSIHMCSLGSLSPGRTNEADTMHQLEKWKEERHQSFSPRHVCSTPNA